MFSNMLYQESHKPDEFLNSSHEKELLQLNRLYTTLSQINHAIVRIQKKIHYCMKTVISRLSMENSELLGLT